jgi:BirA family biotin operon repressor/biotin-[acetyl-CoA-carboxylase] ligase
VVVAAAQTAGRGRLNRTWLSPPGMGLYFSVILRPELAPEDLPKITLAAGLAVCRVIEDEYSVTPQIKWPNDLLLDGSKFGGILTETGSLQNGTTAGTPLVVVGVGLNLFVPENGFPAELRRLATALSAFTDREIVAESLLRACASAIEEEIRCLEQGEFAAILSEWQQRDAVRDKILTWVTPRGRKVTGVSMGPDENGMLRIRDEAGAVHTVISGDVKLVGKISQ